MIRLTAGLSLAALVATVLAAPIASADDVAYLVNVTVRPGYNFPGADAALSYGHGLCGQIADGRSYADIINHVQGDFATTDDYQAGYLITQAANELCPQLIWQLRNSAANYRLSPP